MTLLWPAEAIGGMTMPFSVTGMAKEILSSKGKIIRHVKSGVSVNYLNGAIY